MLKLKDVANVFIENYVIHDGWGITLKEVTEFLNNLTYNDIKLNNFNYFNFPEYNLTIKTFIYVDSYDTIIIKITGIL